MDKAVVVLIALLLNAAFAGPRRFYVALGLTWFPRFPAGLLRTLERKLNREQRSEGERRFRGWLLVFAALVICLAAGLFLGWLFKYNLRFFELLLVALALPVRPLWDLAAEIQQTLFKNELVRARLALVGTPWRHHAVMDEYAVARAAIETLAVGFGEKLVSPVFWYLIFGLPGLLAVKAITFMREALPAGPASAVAFSEGAQQAHELLHYLPVRFSILLVMLVSVLLPGGDWKTAVGDTGRALTQAPHVQLLALMAASSALKFSLGGPGSPYAGEVWTGGGSPKAHAADVKRAMRVYAFSALLFFVFLGLFI